MINQCARHKKQAEKLHLLCQLLHQIAGWREDQSSAEITIDQVSFGFSETDVNISFASSPVLRNHFLG